MPELAPVMKTVLPVREIMNEVYAVVSAKGNGRPVKSGHSD